MWLRFRSCSRIVLDIASYAEPPTLLGSDSVPVAELRSLSPVPDRQEFAPYAISETHQLHDSAADADQFYQGSDKNLAET